MKDLFGKAILDFQTNNNPKNIITSTSITDEDEYEVAYLFRSFNEMPQIEQHALELSKGKILDVGCGAGSHSLYLQEKNLDVTSIDISESAIKACQLRGLKNAITSDVMSFEGKYDTILILMNGTGICGKLKNLPEFLSKLKSLLNIGGQIFIDSSDIIYMFDDDDELKQSNHYYGELTFNVSYKNEKEDSFDWLYVDFKTLEEAANWVGLQCELVLEGEHYDYLARLF